MTPWSIVIVIACYFIMLLSIAWITGRKAGSDAYFIGNRQSIWWLVAIGMLSDSMSGVSFISVPGDVHKTSFHYMQLVMGYVLGYVVIAFVLLPLYYRMGLTSIYSYLGTRFGGLQQKIGAGFFIVSRLIGSAGRLFLTASILQLYLFQAFGFPFWASVAIIIGLILAYTIKGGIKTLVYTDALQSFFLVGALLTCVGILISHIGFEHIQHAFLKKSAPVDWFNFDVQSRTYFWKHFLGGAFVCITMTGLDQNMMQKNLSCRSLRDAQKNILTTAVVVFLVNIVFVSLGALMLHYLDISNLDIPLKNGLPHTDGIFPMLALQKLGLFAGLAFIVGLAAATFSSADSVLTSLTTSTYIDFLGLDRNEKMSETKKNKYRTYLHAGFAVLLLLCILGFERFNNQSLITTILDIAGYTYGPLLGLFGFGILMKAKPTGWPVLLVCIAAPALTWMLKNVWIKHLGGYQFGFEALIINGLLTFAGLAVVASFPAYRKKEILD